MNKSIVMILVGAGMAYHSPVGGTAMTIWTRWPPLMVGS